MPDFNSLLPQPPAPPAPFNPAQALDMVGRLNELRRFQAQQAIGEETQKAISGGQLNTGSALTGISRRPDAALMAPEAASRLLQQQNQNIANTTSQYDLDTAQTKQLDDLWGSMAAKKNLGPNDLFELQARAVRAGVNPAKTFEYTDRLRKYPGGFVQSAKDAQARSTGAAAAGMPTEGPPNPQTLAPTVIPRGQFIQGNTASGMPVGPPAGSLERQVGAAKIDTQLAESLAHEAEGSQQRRALLGNLMDLSDKFEPGPGASQSREAKAFINRNLPLPEGWKFDKGSIASQEEFSKQAAQFAQQQFNTIGGTGTDAKFNSAFTVSPNETMSKMGIKGISQFLLGNEDAIQAKNKAWLDQSKNDPNLSHRRFAQDFNSHFDPRIFQFKYLTADDRKAYFNKLEPQDQARLLHDMTYARKQGWVKYE